MTKIGVFYRIKSVLKPFPRAFFVECTSEGNRSQCIVNLSGVNSSNKFFLIDMEDNLIFTIERQELPILFFVMVDKIMEHWIPAHAR